MNAVSSTENGKSSASLGAIKSNIRQTKSARKDSVNNANDMVDEAIRCIRADGR